MSEKNVPIKLGEIYHKQAADFIRKHAAGSSLKGHAEALRHWPLFEPVGRVFFTECVWQKDNTLSRSAIHLRFQVAPGEFNLESVGLDTSVINQLRAHVCVRVDLRVFVCVINHCLTPYRTHNAWASFSPLRINSSPSDVLTMVGQEDDSISLARPQREEQWEWSMPGAGGESGNLSREEKNEMLEANQERVLEKAWEHSHAHTNPKTHKHPGTRVDESFLKVIGKDSIQKWINCDTRVCALRD